MDRSLFEAFLEPARNVWASMLESSLSLVEQGSQELVRTESDIAAIIRLVGNVSGTVAIGFAAGFAHRATCQMLGMQPDEVDAADSETAVMVDSAIGEIANMIAGGASVKLSETGLGCDITPPEVIRPRGAPFASTDCGSFLSATDAESADIQISVRLDASAAPVAA